MSTKRSKHHRFTTKKNKNRENTKYPVIFSRNTTNAPGNDFYMFINGKWMRKTTIPPYLSSYSVSDEIEEQIDEELLTILDSSREARNTSNKQQYLLGTLVESILNTKSQSMNVNYVRHIISRIGCVRTMTELGSIQGEFIRFQVNTPLCFTVLPSEFQTNLYRLTITPGKLGLPDSTYYLQSTDENKAALNAYNTLLVSLGKDFTIPHISDIISLEKDVAHYLHESNYDEEILLKGSEIVDRYSSIPWETLVHEATGWTISNFKQHTITVVSESWLKNVNHWCKSISLDTWKHWMALNFLLHCLPLLPTPYDTMDYELYGHKLRGQMQKLPKRRLALHLAEKWLSSSLGELFVHKYVDPQIKVQVLEIAKEIRHVAADVVGMTEWLEHDTQEKAKRKVQSLYLSIAYPSRFKKDHSTKLHDEHIIENILNLAETDFKSELKKVNTLLQKEQWDDDVFAVNAYYYNEGNRLILPSGILRWPFFHTSVSDGWNFGGLGATIGHEICHAFDDDGKNYDEHGKKKSWWSNEESERFKQKTEALIKLFNKEVYFGKHINGRLTLSENIADLAGLSISLKALKTRLEKKDILSKDDLYKKEIRDFFISYATSWRTKEKRQKARQSIFMDVHAPSSARVNQIVCHFDDWYECFGIQPGDRLYIDPEHRIRIF
jgi:putative endopeptidase